MTEYNYKILQNMPFDDIKSHWESDKDNLDDPHMFWEHPGIVVKTWRLIYLLEPHPLTNIIKNMFAQYGLSVYEMTYMISEARLGMDKIHIDPEHRLSAINIPIQIEEEHQFFLQCTDECIETVRTASGAPKFLYEPEKCAFYNSKRPFVFDPLKPHGFANYADTERVVLSITLETPYSEVIDILPKEWF